MHNYKRQIALLRARREDINLITHLLNDEPFDVVPHDDVHSIADLQFEAEVGAKEVPEDFCVVVCARVTEPNSSESSNSILKHHVTHDLGQLSSRFKRVLVLTDSMDEPAVCSYLNAGAHHVIPLNDTPHLMQARLLAGLRQHSEPMQKEWHVGPYHFDLSRRTVTMDGENLRLSPREFELAHYLFEHRERTVPTAEILESVWSLPAYTDSRRIDTAACRVRKKMMLGQRGEWQLRRMRREGYQIVRCNDAHAIA